jgi:hypothetical protein
VPAGSCISWTTAARASSAVVSSMLKKALSDSVSEILVNAAILFRHTVVYFPVRIAAAACNFN